MEVKMMEPRRKNNTTTSVNRSQTIILTADRDDGALVQITLIAVVKEILGDGHEGFKQPRIWNYYQHAKRENKTPKNPMMKELNKQ